MRLQSIPPCILWWRSIDLPHLRCAASTWYHDCRIPDATPCLVLTTRGSQLAVKATYRRSFPFISQYFCLEKRHLWETSLR